MADETRSRDDDGPGCVMMLRRDIGKSRVDIGGATCIAASRCCIEERRTVKKYARLSRRRIIPQITLGEI